MMKPAYMSMKSQLGFSNKDLIAYIFTKDFSKLNQTNLPTPDLLKCLSNSSLPYCN